MRSSRPCFAPVKGKGASGRIFLTQDGSPSLFHERLGVSYHSKYGAWRETQHVFIDAGLRLAALDQPNLSILDVGFGTGLNAYATFQLAQQQTYTLDYVALEAYPLDRSTLAELDYPNRLGWQSRERKLWDDLHAASWDAAIPFSSGTTPHTLHKRRAYLEDLAEVNRFDLVYYDAFAPEAQPELWTAERFAQVARALRAGGILVTYCAKGQVKRDLRAVGFDVEALPGPPGKREMTRATWRGPRG